MVTRLPTSIAGRPGRDLQSLCGGLIPTDRSRIPKSNGQRRTAYRDLLEEDIRLPKATQLVISQLTPMLQKGATPTLLRPDFASLPEDLPFVKMPRERTEENKQELKPPSIYAQILDVIINAYASKLHAGRDLDSSLIRIFHCCLTSWISSATALREAAIDLFQRWEGLVLAGSGGSSVPDQELALRKKYGYVPNDDGDDRDDEDQDKGDDDDGDEDEGDGGDGDDEDEYEYEFEDDDEDDDGGEFERPRETLPLLR